VIDTSMCFADPSSGDEFESNQYSRASSKAYVKPSAIFREGIDNYANPIETETGGPALLELEERVTLVCAASEITGSESDSEPPFPVEVRF
jgi:hypothetical protein